jgi:hypothetical protein
VWHPQQRAATPAETIALDAGASPVIEFRLDAAPRKAKYKPPLDRLKY